MLFVSFEFLFFFVFVYLIYWILPAGRFRFYFLLTSSLVFYGTWSIPFLFHLLGILTFNYFGWAAYRKRNSKAVFIFIQSTNVLNLAFFKYFYFISDLLSGLLGLPGLSETVLRESHKAIGYEILLPLAISFYTFQVMSYGFDLRNGTYTAKHSFWEFVLFISFFPQLIAGPIVRSQDLLPQVRKLKEGSLPFPSLGSVQDGIWLLLSGIIKKIFIADQLLRFIQPVFSPEIRSVDKLSPWFLWLLSFSFLVMLYADFSGYSDLARGLGKLLGFELPLNFKAPFLFSSFGDLWKRWHLTFSTWIRDYIFIPLGGSRVSEGRLWFNLIFTFLLGGLWHGAKLPFALWGICMGVFLSIEASLSKRQIYEFKTPFSKILHRILIWFLYLSSGVFFFAPSASWGWEAVLKMTGGLFSSQEAGIYLPNPEGFLLSVFVVFLFQLAEEYPESLAYFKKIEYLLLPIAAILVALGMTQFLSGRTDFYYFQF